MDEHSDQPESELTLQGILQHRGMFKALFDSLPMQVVIKSAKSETFGKFLLWNRTASQWIGLQEKDVLGKTDSDFFPPDQAEHFLRCDQGVIATRQPLDIPSEKLSVEGDRDIILHTVKTPIFGDDGEPLAILLVSEDITEKVEAESEAKRLTEFLQRVTQEMPGAVFEFHSDADGSYRFAYVSIGAERLFELPEHALRNDSSLLFRHIVPPELPSVMESLEQSRLGLTGWSQDFHIETPNGRKKCLHVHSTPRPLAGGGVVWFGFVSDVTEIRRQGDWRRALQLLEHVTAQIPGAVYQMEISKTRDIRFTYLSRGFARLCGLSAVAVESDPSLFFNLIVPEDREVVRESLLDAGEELSAWQREFRICRPDGSVQWLVGNARLGRDASGSTLLHGHLANISHSKHVQLELEEARDAAQRASSAKSDFLAMLSHEIRTPLNAILGFADVLGWTNLNSRQRECVETIRESGGTLLAILNDVLDFSKMEADKLDLQPEPCDIGSIGQGVIDLFRAKAREKGLKLRFDGPKSPIHAIADPIRIRQILGNLLSNSLKFTRKGEVRLSVEASPLGQKADWLVVRFHVRDTGIGIPKNKQRKLFQPFEQIDNSFKREAGGTGLGLSIVKRLSNLMGGDVSVESEEDAGSEFTVWISCMSADAGAIAPVATGKPEQIPGHSLSEELPLRILIVEDNAVNRRLLRLLLERLGYHPDEASDGETGIRMAGESSYDLVLLDLRMPGMDGFEAARLLRGLGEGHAKRIVAVTAHTSPTVRENCVQAGMSGFLPKPVQPKTLETVIRETGLN